MLVIWRINIKMHLRQKVPEFILKVLSRLVTVVYQNFGLLLLYA